MIPESERERSDQTGSGREMGKIELTLARNPRFSSWPTSSRFLQLLHLMDRNRFFRGLLVTGMFGWSCSWGAEVTNLGTPPAELVRQIPLIIPKASGILIEDDSVIPGEYVTGARAPGGPKRYWLVPGGKYSSADHTDVGTYLDQGDWTLEKGLLVLTSEGLWSEPKGRVETFAAVRLRIDGVNDEDLLVGTEAWSRRFSSMLNPPSPEIALRRIGAAAAARVAKPGSAEASSLQERWELDFGRYGVAAITTLFQGKFAKATRATGGGWVLTGSGSGRFLYGFRELVLGGMTEVGRMADNLSRSGGNLSGWTEITLGGVVLRAGQIEFGRKLESVHLSGTVQVVGGKLPASPGIEIYIEGKRVSP